MTVKHGLRSDFPAHFLEALFVYNVLYFFVGHPLNKQTIQYLLVSFIIMPYRKWNHRCNVATLMNWYNVNELMGVIQAIRIYLLETNPARMPAEIYILQPRSPFDYNQRFPEGALFICESIGKWGKLINQVMIYASLLTYPNKIQSIYPQADTIGNIEIELLNKIEKVLKEVSSHEYMFHRKNFERRYSIHWETTLEDNIDDLIRADQELEEQDANTPIHQESLNDLD